MNHKIYCARHGETNYNREGLANYDPNVNVFLTENGKKQAEELAKKLRDKTIDLIIVSELLRTHETADIVNAFHNAPLLIDARLNDIYNGFEGKSVDEYHAARDNAPDPLSFKVNGAESMMDINQRTRDFLNSLQKRTEQNILIVTSNNNMKQIDSIVNNRPLIEIFNLHIPNASFFEFDI